MGCGYTYPQIDAMLVTDVWDLLAEMVDQPPTHVLVAAFVGFKPPKANRVVEAAPAEVEKNFGQGAPMSSMPDGLRKWHESNSPMLKQAIDLATKGKQ